MARIQSSDAIARITALDFRSDEVGLRRAKVLSAPIELVRSIDMSGDSQLFLIRQGDIGYIAPADDGLEPVIGECEETDFTLELPPAMEEWLDDYAREVEWLNTSPVPSMVLRVATPQMRAAASPSTEKTADVAKLIATKWNQTSPWNQNLKFEGKSCYAGCVPICIAQLLYYWWTKGFSRGCAATEAYTSKTNLYEVSALPPVKVFDFADMVTGKPTTAQAKKAVADMLQHVGYAVKADYKPTGTGSSTKDYIPALSEAFRLGSNIQQIFASKLGLESFKEKVRKELSSGRPVMICGSNSNNKGRHAFLCDGYRSSDDKFHFNWGWGGQYDGYFLMGALKPTSARDYSYYKAALINVQPEYRLGDANRDGQVDISDVLEAVDHTVKGTFSESADVNSDGKVDIEDAKDMVNAILGKEKL